MNEGSIRDFDWSWYSSYAFPVLKGNPYVDKPWHCNQLNTTCKEVPVDPCKAQNSPKTKHSSTCAVAQKFKVCAMHRILVHIASVLSII